jgi:hypothetical protein
MMMTHRHTHLVLCSLLKLSDRFQCRRTYNVVLVTTEPPFHRPMDLHFRQRHDLIKNIAIIPNMPA